MLRQHWRIAVVLAFTVAALVRVVTFPFSIIDDPSNVVNNPLVAAPMSQGLMGLLRTTAMGYPHTVTVLSFSIDRDLFGVNPAGYHAVNLLIHLANVVLLYALLLRLRIPLEIAWFPAAVFALHPIVVEPVAWVIGRKDLLSAGFVLVAMLVIAHGPEEDDGPTRDPRWIEAALLCVLAIFSKPSAIMAPALMWLFIRCARPRWSPVHIVIAMTPVAAAAVFVVLAGVPGLEDQGAVVRREPLLILLDIVRAWTLQVQHVFWPRNLLAEYERSALGEPPVWMMVVALTVTMAVAAAAWRYAGRRSIERMGLLFLIAAYLPAAGFLPTWHWTADSYFYLPLAGLLIAAAPVLARAWRPSFTAVWALVPLFAVLSYQQAHTWSSGSATFAPVAAHYADDPRPLNRLAFAHLYEGNPDAAAPLFIKLERMAPEFPYNRAQRVWAADRLGEKELAERVLKRCEAERDASCLVEVQRMRGSR